MLSSYEIKLIIAQFPITGHLFKCIFIVIIPGYNGAFGYMWHGDSSESAN